MVFAQHYVSMPWGYTGVDLFFVLSGFLITGILHDSRERPDRVRTFFIRRTLRIFPLYYGLGLALLLLTPILRFEWSAWWLAWPLYLGNFLRFLHPYSTSASFLLASDAILHMDISATPLYMGHFWSLCVEEQFYLVWPWVVFYVKDRKRLLAICAAVILTLPVLRVVALSLLPQRFTEMALPYSFTPLRIDAMLFGAALALLIRGQERQRVLLYLRRFFYVATCGVLLFLVATVHRHVPYAYRPWRLTWGQSLIDLFYVAGIAAVIVPRGGLYSALCVAPLRQLGRISYGMYVFHDIPQDFFRRLVLRLGLAHPAVARHTDDLTAVVAFLCTLALASLSWRYFESRFINLKEKWAPSR